MELGVDVGCSLACLWQELLFDWAMGALVSAERTLSPDLARLPSYSRLHFARAFQAASNMQATQQTVVRFASGDG